MTTTSAAAKDIFHIFKRMNPLIQHACDGNVEEVRALLAQGNGFDQAAVMGAAISGQHECLALFLPLNAQSWGSALIWATMEGKATCVQLLLDNKPNFVGHSVGEALTDSVRFNHECCTKILVDHIIQNPTSADVNWNLLLHKSVEYQNTPAFLAIWPHCDTSHHILKRCLNETCSRGMEQCVEVLAPLCPQWNPLEVFDSFLQAIHKGHTSVVHVLLPYIDVSYDDSYALRLAVEFGDEEMAEILYAGSDLEAAWAKLEAQGVSPENLSMLKEQICQQQHTALTQAVDGNTHLSRTKKM